MSIDRKLLLDRRVAVAFVLQVLGYAALLAVYPHSETSVVLDALQVVPTLLLVPFALPALPALALTVLLGAVASLAGLPPESLPPLLLARGDVLFFASAVVVAVAAAWANRRAAALADRVDRGA